MKKRISLKEGIEFHGHLGPYLVLGIMAGELALRELKCKKYFGLEVKVWGVTHKPKSCLIDGLQLSTGATFGKGNISKLEGHIVEIEIRFPEEKKKITLTIQDHLRKRIERALTHKESELLAKQIYRMHPAKIFHLTVNNWS